MESIPPLPQPNYESRGSSVVVCAVVMMTLSTLAVTMRFGSRIMLPSYYFWWDDWAVLATLALSHGFLSCAVYWTTIGLGRHTWMIPLELTQANININWATLSLYATTIWMLRLSALLFYARLFRINRRFILGLWMMGCILTGWWITTMLVPWSFCDPWSKNINPTIPGSCIHGTAWHRAVAFINFFLDLVVLILPMPVIWKLQMSSRKKIAVTVVFLLGYSSAFLSLARFIMIEINPHMLNAGPTADMSWDLVPLMFPSFLEAPVAIVALCGPSINRLATHIYKQGTFTSLFSRSGRKGTFGSDYSAPMDNSKRSASTKASDLSRDHQLHCDNNSTTAIMIHDGDWDTEGIAMRPIGKN
ncbi:hypothetical protein B0I35DRAFT_446077 [Stachybotrys elegans]|uniref:Rhodopsin domain-containing protein n=1 Tax=Stachybotrys elegans TaxID=80388 RepID=A0A8K0WJ46_9HYPO|nr:hypothetical protein B0I35DRAFT_446077 [Stachybotrys elegans]